MAVTALMQLQVVQNFVALFGRPPAGQEGLGFYANELGNGKTIQQVAQEMYDTAPARKYFPLGLTNDQIVTSFFTNVFGRPPAEAGLRFWSTELGTRTPGDVIRSMIDSALTPGVDATVKALLEHKFDVAKYWAENNKGLTSNIDAVLTGITPTTDTSSPAAIEAYLVTTVQGQTFTLTAGDDNFTGTDGPDTISANVSGSSNTLNDGDTLNAGNGTDVLNVRVTSLTGAVSTAPVLNGVEKVSVSNSDGSGNPYTVNLAAATGTSEVEFKNSGASSNTTFLNVAPTAVITLDNADSQSQKVNFGPATGRTGNSDAFTVNIANGTGSLDVGAVFNLVGTDGTTDDTSFETANVKVSGAPSVVFMGTGLAGLTTVNVTGETTGVTQGFFGSQESFGLVLWQVTNFSNLAKVDASGMTGSGGLQILALGTTATGFTFTGSNSADYLFLGTTALNASGTLNGGGGKDILATNSFSTVSTAVNKAIGFEVLQALNPVSSLEANTFTTINEFLISGGPSGSRLNITGVESTDRFVFTNDQGSGDETVRFTAAAAGESVTFEMRAGSGAGGEIAIVSNTSTGNDVGAIGFQNNVSSVTIDSTGQNSAANLIEAVDNGSFLYYAFKNDNGLANFKITGSQSLTISAKEGVDFSSNPKLTGFLEAANVDASGFTGVLRIAGSNLADVIKGGSGNDIIYGLGGNDSLTGNDGSDQFRMVGTGGKDSIKDFAKGTDKIGINDVDFANTTATSAGAALSTQDYVDNRQGITSIGAADNHKVIELQTGLSTSQIQTDTGAAIEAYVLVFNTTTGKAELWFDDNWSDAGRTQVATFDNVVDLVGVQGFQNTDFVEFVA